MFSFDLLVSILGILSGFYALPYANWEFSQRNKTSAIMIYIIALASVFLSVFQYFV